ncbi:MAG: translation initiation factor IF-2 [Bacteroidales bacterium]|nr:translation initiation factor IF-2 [Bacteroidales bacterium]
MEQKATRLSKAARIFNVGISTIVDFLHKQGIDIDSSPNAKIAPEAYDLLAKEYSSDLSIKKKSEEFSQLHFKEQKEDLPEAVEEKKEEEPISLKEKEIFVKDSTAPSTKIAEEKTPEPEPVVEAKKETKEKEEKVPAKQAEPKKKTVKEKPAEEKIEEVKPEKVKDIKVVGKIDLESFAKKPKASQKAKKKVTAKEKDVKEVEEKETKKVEEKIDVPVVEEKVASQPEKIPEDKTEVVAAEPEAAPEEKEIFKSKIEKLSGPTVVGKIDLPVVEPKKKPIATSRDTEERKKKRRRIVSKKAVPPNQAGKEKPSTEKDTRRHGKKRKPFRPEVSEEEVQQQIKDTLAQLSGKGKSKGAKYRREKREAVSQRSKEELEKSELEKNILNVAEFVSVSELASMMDVPVIDVISTCMTLGVMVSINQRLDAETMSIVADEFGYKVQFVSAEILETIVEDDEESNVNLQPRPPIVTVMGHVDHGKTKLLDYIRSTNVIAGEAGGITQHIGAYSVSLDDGRKITFLDTPGHEAFTAMRARGAQVTDIAIIVIAADDGVKPQTVEAINHAQAANVPMIFAINKIDKPTANPEKIKEELSGMNLLVEDWGGKYQSQEISAINGKNIDDLLEKVLLEAELLELKANPDKNAVGIVLESTLDKGKGFVTTMLVNEGTLNMGDIILAGSHFGHAKAMFNERDGKMEVAGPSMPVTLLGLNGAPQAGDKFNIMDSDREAKEIANKRSQLQREQSLRTKKHITLDEIGRRIAVGSFQELNVVVKGDVDGSVEALSDSLLKLSTEEIQLNVIHKAVGQISESDIMLAVASNAVVIGFQVRPSLGARQLAEKEQIDIRLYSIIYAAIEEIRAAMEGMLSPEVREEIVATVEVQETFKINKLGTIAGCIVKEGKIKRDNKVRIIREGIVIYSGELGSLKRFKDDVKEVVSGLECGLNISNFNDIKVGDMVEAYKETEVKKTL